MRVSDTEAIADDEDEIIVRGAVKWFDPVRGYGFLVPDDSGSDVLLHFSGRREIGRRTLPEGATLTCAVVARDRGRQARRIIEYRSVDRYRPRSRNRRGPRGRSDRPARDDCRRRAVRTGRR